MSVTTAASNLSIEHVRRHQRRPRQCEDALHHPVWLGPMPAPGDDPEFVVVISRGEVREPLDHVGFQCDERDEVTALAARAREAGILVEGPTDYGGSVGYFVLVREPSGHLVEFTHGQPLKGLASRNAVCR